MKKYLILILLLLFIIIGVLYIDSYRIKEDDQYVVVKKDIVLKVYEEYKLSEFIDITEGKLLKDIVFDTNKVGEEKQEILYLNKYKRKRKAYIDYKVIDDIPPIILGGNTKTLKKGDTSKIEHLFLSADNYDKVPNREIIGTYDVNKVGNYNLTLKVTDSSNNITTKDFVLTIVNTIPSAKPSNARTIYSDVFKTHKKENVKIGLDISKWQGDVDFDKLLKNNVEFVMLRVGYQKGFNDGYEIDPYFYDNIKKLNELNIPMGIYFYSYATSTKEAKKQALWVVDKIKDYKISLPIVFDFESFSNFSTLNISLYDINEISKTFLKTIKENGYDSMNYSSKYYLENIWDIDEYPVWLAHYTTKTDYSGKYVMWQLCNNGKIEGINGNVDINILYDVNMIKK